EVERQWSPNRLDAGIEIDLKVASVEELNVREERTSVEDTVGDIERTLSGGGLTVLRDATEHVVARADERGGVGELAAFLNRSVLNATIGKSRTRKCQEGNARRACRLHHRRQFGHCTSNPQWSHTDSKSRRRAPACVLIVCFASSA